MEPGLVLGRARIGLFVGLAAIVGGLALGSFVGTWIGVVLVALAFGANVVAKVSHFRTLPLSPERRTRLAALWFFLAVATVALIADAVAERTLTGFSGAFWPLVLVVVVLGAAYRYFRAQYLDGEVVDPE